jgi:hypothetical protein
MKRPLREIRPLGPFIDITQDFSTGEPEGSSNARNWNDEGTDYTRNLQAPEDWDWIVGDELAHHAWQMTVESDDLNFGPEPDVLLESFMGFFPDRGMTDSINSWYLTRKKGESYEDHTVWWQIGNQFGDPSGDPDTTDRLYDTEVIPHPLRSKLHSQQFTSNGGMFTYDFTQWQGEIATGMMRVPVDTSLLADIRTAIEPTPFEEFQYQSRSYSLGSQYADDVAEGTYGHPHFRAEDDATLEDYKELFDIALKFMERSVEVENS